MKRAEFSVEVITLPMSDVERALRFMSIRSASRSTSTIRRAPAARSKSVMDSPMLPWVHFAMSFSSSRTSRRRGPAWSNMRSMSVRSGPGRPSEPATEVLYPGSTARAKTMPVSPVSPTRMARAGCCRNGATAICDAAGKRSRHPMAEDGVRDGNPSELVARRQSVRSSRNLCALCGITAENRRPWGPRRSMPASACHLHSAEVQLRVK